MLSDANAMRWRDSESGMAGCHGKSQHGAANERTREGQSARRAPVLTSGIPTLDKGRGNRKALGREVCLIHERRVSLARLCAWVEYDSMDRAHPADSVPSRVAVSCH